MYRSNNFKWPYHFGDNSDIQGEDNTQMETKTYLLKSTATSYMQVAKARSQMERCESYSVRLLTKGNDQTNTCQVNLKALLSFFASFTHVHAFVQ